MTSLVAWIVFPAVLYAVAAGLGLLAGTLLRAPLPAALVAPVGACLGIVVSLAVYQAGGARAPAAVLLAVLAAGGYVAARRDLRARLDPGRLGLAALAGYALYLAPVVLSGTWTWLGYNFVNDTAVNMVITDHVAQHGVGFADATPATTTTNLINGTLGGNYPVGIHALLATLHAYVGFVPLEAVYQPFIAALAGLAALALARLALSAGIPAWPAAALGVVAAGANLAYQYAAHGAFKELAVVAVVATAAALSAEAVEQRLRAGVVAQLGVVLAAAIVIFSTAGVAYAGTVAAVLLGAAVLVRHRARPVAFAVAAAAGAAALIVAALPGLADAVSFGRTASTFYEAAGGLSGPNSVAFLGHLLRPLPLQQAIGIWPDQEYRLPLAGAPDGFTDVMTAVVVVLIAVVAVAEVARRRAAALLVLLPAAAVYLVGAPRLGPYAEAKLLVILSPAVVFAAGAGAWYLARRWAPAGLLAAVALAGGVVYSDALAYHAVRLAPVDRLEQLRDAADRATADELILAPEWEEWAKYFARGRAVNVAPESFSPAPVALRESFSYFGHSVDLDQVHLDYVQGFPWVLLRRSPTASRPPSNYRLAYRNASYELWRREDRGQVREHLPLQALQRAGDRPACADVRALARGAAPGEVIVGARAPRTLLFDYTAQPPAGWTPTANPATVEPHVPGRARGELRAAGGRYRVWLRGSTGRTVRLSVDGREVGTARAVNTPEQWLHVAEVDLEPGRHDTDLLRPGGSLYPGDGFRGELGSVAFEPMGAPRSLVTAAPRAAARTFCGGTWDWLERVRPGSA